MSPNFHNHVSVSDLYIPRIVKQEDRSWENINRSGIQKCRKWERGRAVSFLGIHKLAFRVRGEQEGMPLSKKGFDGVQKRDPNLHA